MVTPNVMFRDEIGAAPARIRHGRRGTMRSSRLPRKGLQGSRGDDSCSCRGRGSAGPAACGHRRRGGTYQLRTDTSTNVDGWPATRRRRLVRCSPCGPALRQRRTPAPTPCALRRGNVSAGDEAFGLGGASDGHHRLRLGQGLDATTADTCVFFKAGGELRLRLQPRLHLADDDGTVTWSIPGGNQAGRPGPDQPGRRRLQQQVVERHRRHGPDPYNRAPDPGRASCELPPRLLPTVRCHARCYWHGVPVGWFVQGGSHE